MEVVLKEALLKEKNTKIEKSQKEIDEKRFQEEIQSIKKVVKMDVDEWRDQSGNYIV